MATCYGRRLKTGNKCSSTLYQCKYCGHVGCRQPAVGTCTNQAFRSGRCLRCGKSGYAPRFK